LDILTSIGLPPDIVAAADIDETPLKNENPRLYALRVAQGKNTALIAQFPNDYILTADTTVAVGRRILGKPDDGDDAARMFRLLSGRNHRVYTAVVVYAPDGRSASRIVESRVKIKPLSETDIAHAVASNEWQGRAAGYSFQGYFSRFIQKIIGSAPGIIGLPAYESANLLTGLGYKGKHNAPDQA
jgi:septum formation protein